MELAIEYDGRYFHSSNSKLKADIQKTEDLNKQGIEVMRVREKPLKKLNPLLDIVIDIDDDNNHFKRIVDNVLTKILEVYFEKLPKTIKNKIQNYLSQNCLQNENEREVFITETMQKRELKKYHDKNEIDFLPFTEAKKEVRSLNIKSQSEWKHYVKNNKLNDRFRTIRIPHDPYSYYKNKGWKDWSDWLGTKKKDWRNFSEARKFIRSLNFKNRVEWRLYIYGELLDKGCKPHDIPNCPEKVYKQDGWKDLKDWLGTG